MRRLSPACRLGGVLSRQELALIVITAFWGVTFLIVQRAMQYCGPLFFVGLRFLTAALLGSWVFRRACRGLNRHDLYAGGAIGLSICLGYVLQTWGLKTVTVSQSAFLTGLYVPLVPFLQWLLMRRRPRLMNLVGILLAFIGMMLMAGPGPVGVHLSQGEWLTLACAVAIAFEIVLIGYFAGKADLRRVTIIQLYVAGLLSLVMMPAVREPLPVFSWVWLLAAVVMGCSSILIQMTMNWAQRTVLPTRATLIYAGEPVWGGLAGYAAGERLSSQAILGGALIVSGVLVSELRLRRSAPPSIRDGA